MYIHHYLRMDTEGKLNKDNESMFNKLKSYVLDYSSKAFYYNIGGLNFSLEEIKHGILRGNKKNPNYFTRSFANNDPRACIL